MLWFLFCQLAQLSVHTIGGVVQPAPTLMVVVPDDSKLEVEAMLPNRDAGFVHAGEAAELGRSLYVHALRAVAWDGPQRQPRRSAEGARRSQPRPRPIFGEIAAGGRQGFWLGGLGLCRADLARRDLGGDRTGAVGA